MLVADSHQDSLGGNCYLSDYSTFNLSLAESTVMEQRDAPHSLALVRPLSVC
jgi:hypothetical protein